MYFDEKYFMRETRCGFDVPAIMKRAWAAELEVLKVIIDICDRNDIQYFAAYGTLLGAVRHGGFIPWDDDIDLHVKREDYEKLARVLPQQLPDGFFMRGMHAEKPSGIEVVDTLYQIYVSAERPFWERNEYMRYFHGYPFDYVGIDIFPLDYIPYDTELFDVQKTLIDIALLLYWNWDTLKETGALERRLDEFAEVSGVPVPQENRRFHLVKMMDAIASLYHEYEGGTLIDYVFIQTFHSLDIKKEWYDDVIYMPFENMEIAVPAGYDGVLKACYGDYKQFVRGSALHGYPFYEEMEEKLAKELAEAGCSLSVEEFCERVLSGEIVCV